MDMRLPTATIETRDGRTRGVAVTDRDVSRLRLLARWGALTTRQIAAIEADWDIETDRGSMDRRAEIVRQRMRLMEQMVGWDGEPAPLVGAVTLPNGARCWYPTAHAGDWIEGTWDLRRLPYVGAMGGLLAVADAAHGLAGTVSKMGARLLSGREMRTATDADGCPIPVALAPRRGYPMALGILAGDGSTGVVVEVEARQFASQIAYEKALAEHAQNPALTAIWVLVSNEFAQRKYAAAAATLTREHPDTRIRISRMTEVNGFFRVDLTTEMKRDLITLSQRRAT